MFLFKEGKIRITINLLTYLIYGIAFGIGTVQYLLRPIPINEYCKSGYLFLIYIGEGTCMICFFAKMFFEKFQPEQTT